jgi:hypothetical protein
MLTLAIISLFLSLVYSPVIIAAMFKQGCSCSATQAIIWAFSVTCFITLKFLI